MAGKLVRTLVDTHHDEARTYEATWSGRDNSGRCGTQWEHPEPGDGLSPCSLDGKAQRRHSIRVAGKAIELFLTIPYNKRPSDSCGHGLILRVAVTLDLDSVGGIFMRRIVLIALTLGFILSLVTACSDDAVEPALTMNGEKKGPEPDPEIQPPEWAAYFLSLYESFAEQDWTDNVIKMESLGSGSISVVPVDYPDGYAIVVTAEGNLDALVDAEDLILSVVAKPNSGTVEIPGDCIIYRTFGKLPEGVNITFSFPIVSWYDTSEYSGDFSAYDLELVDGAIEPIQPEWVSMIWPVPTGSLYSSITVELKKDDVDNILYHVLDPDEPGDRE